MRKVGIADGTMVDGAKVGRNDGLNDGGDTGAATGDEPPPPIVSQNCLSKSTKSRTKQE